MHNKASHLLRLTNQLLDLSRLEAGGMRLEASQGDIVAFTEATVALFNSLANRNKINYSFACDQSELQTYFDRDKIKKILVNLISNALKYTPEGGTVTVELEKSNEPLQGMEALEGTVVIKVIDTGTGIAKGQLAKIFDRRIGGFFVQSHKLRPA